MGAHRLPLALLLFVALLSPASQAFGADAPPVPVDACDNWRHPGLSDGPIRIGFLPGDLGTGHRACPRSEVSLWLRGAAIIDTPGFYGALGASGLLSGSYAFGRRRNFEVFGTLEFFQFQFSQNASLKGTAMSLGPLTLGASYARRLHKVVLSSYGRLLLPTASHGAPTAGAELGVTASYHPLRALEVHGVFAVDLTFALPPYAIQPRGGVLVSAGILYAPFSWLALGLDLNMHFAYRSAFDYLAPAFALRFRLYKTLGLELAATVPVVGEDRHDFLAALRISYRF